MIPKRGIKQIILTDISALQASNDSFVATWASARGARYSPGYQIAGFQPLDVEIFSPHEISVFQPNKTIHYFKPNNSVKFLNLILFGRGVAMIRTIDMKPIMMVYPGFQMLPKGLKQLLVESESFFFEEETTFFRRDRTQGAALGVNKRDFSGGHRMSISWEKLDGFSE